MHKSWIKFAGKILLPTSYVYNRQVVYGGEGQDSGVSPRECSGDPDTPQAIILRQQDWAQIMNP